MDEIEKLKRDIEFFEFENQLLREENGENITMNEELKDNIEKFISRYLKIVNKKRKGLVK